MNQKEIVDAYIEHIRELSEMNNETLKNDPGLIEKIESILFNKEKIDMTTLTIASTANEKDEIELRETSTKIDIYVDNGLLSVEELKKLIQYIREIEQNNAKRVIKIFIDTPEKTVGEMKEIIDNVNPNFPYKMVVELPRQKME